ncbi:MAG: hypothetical protein QNJ54_24760 [Prochloraceae cyanobacterium]|nr:hypothetical protein [Prochloraceae cyanobacterium]
MNVDLYQLDDIDEEDDEQLVELPPISTTTIALLEKQEISLTQPGSILQDFQSFLDYIGSLGIAVSSKQKVLTRKSLAQFNL